MIRTLAQLRQAAMAIMAEVAEAVAMPVYRGDAAIVAATKADGSDVTDADTQTETLLTEKLTALLAAPVLGEETAGDGGAWKRSPLLNLKGDLWIVDPIDGTYYFKRRQPFGMLVSLRRGDETVLGIAYYPVTREFLYASAEVAGAFHGRLIDGQVQGERIAVPPVDRLLLAGGFYGDDVAAGAAALIGAEAVAQFPQGIEPQYCIATALYRLLLQGHYAWFNGSRSGYKPWDFEATTFIARAAGAVVTHLDGAPAHTSPTASTILFAPDRAISDLICAGYRRLQPAM